VDEAGEPIVGITHANGGQPVDLGVLQRPPSLGSLGGDGIFAPLANRHWTRQKQSGSLMRRVQVGGVSVYATPATPMRAPSKSVKCPTTNPFGEVARPMTRVPPSSTARCNAASTSWTPT
jgi:hypothetical protein